MTEFTGTHGTTKTRALSINQTGFKASKVGKRGAGVYFWAYHSNGYEAEARNFAIGWWNYSNIRGDYSKDQDKSCCVLYSTISVKQSIDLEDQEIKEQFVEYYKKVESSLESDGHTGDVLISKVYDMFLSDLESKLNITFDLIHVKVQPPKKMTRTIPFDILGNPGCYVVQNTSCIQLDKCEDVIQ